MLSLRELGRIRQVPVLAFISRFGRLKPRGTFPYGPKMLKPTAAGTIIVQVAWGHWGKESNSPSA